MARTAPKTITVPKSFKTKVDSWNRKVRKLDKERQALLKRKDVESKSFEKDVLSFQKSFSQLQTEKKAIEMQAKKKGLKIKAKK